MLNVIREDQGKVLVLRLIGMVDERVNLDSIVGMPSKEIHFHCKEITRISSLGVRLWVQHLQKLEDAKTPMKFFELSPALMHQLNVMLNFIPLKAKIISVCAPYLCTNCKGNSVGIFNTEDIRDIRLAGQAIPKLKCPKCGSVSEFDDHESSYFSFITRRQSR